MGAVTQAETMKNKEAALEFMKLIKLGQFKDGLRLFSPDCKTHNPYTAGSISALIDAMVAANAAGKAQTPNAIFSVEHSLADGDMVCVHTKLFFNGAKASDGGLRQAHLFRFENGKIAEYWDITQLVTPDMPNAGGAF
jgi:predicted SnoaL-like aldol condensation-catalyzing enzyme